MKKRKSRRKRNNYKKSDVIKSNTNSNVSGKYENLRTINWFNTIVKVLICIVILLFIYSIVTDNPYSNIVCFYGILFLCVVPFGYKIIQNLSISSELARKIEIIGYLMMFSSIIWEFVFKDIIMADFTSDYVYWNMKLDYIFTYIRYLFNDGAWNPDVINIKDYYALGRDEFLEAELFTMDMITASVELLSAIFIAVGRFDELRKNKG